MSNNSQWIEIRNDKNKLLFKYNPFNNEIELYAGGGVYQIVKLDEIRRKYDAVPAICLVHSIPLVRM